MFLKEMLTVIKKCLYKFYFFFSVCVKGTLWCQQKLILSCLNDKWSEIINMHIFSVHKGVKFEGKMADY